jgi:four helix bundle protein
MEESEDRGIRHLDVYQIAHELAVRVHAMSLKLPWFEHREEGPQIRRSSKSVAALLVEGYRLRKYRDEFLHYLHRASGSADESLEHLTLLHETGSLKDDTVWRELSAGYDRLLGKLTNFIMGVERDHSKPFYLQAGSPSEASTGTTQSSPQVANRKSQIPKSGEGSPSRG